MSEDIVLHAVLKPEMVKQLLSFLVIASSIGLSGHENLATIDSDFLSKKQKDFISKHQNSLHALIMDESGNYKSRKLFQVQGTGKKKTITFNVKAIRHILNNLTDNNSRLIKYPSANISDSKFRSSIQYYVFKTLKHDEYFDILNLDGSINIHYLNNQITEIYGHELDPVELKEVLYSLVDVDGNQFVLEKNGKFFANKKLSEILLIKKG
ncbi:MAG: hypothetical protein IPI60_18790 [Saprospiraceae bacterium]|nr:hypothetical protein [Saprospiraceae bacterium]